MIKKAFENVYRNQWIRRFRNCGTTSNTTSFKSTCKLTACASTRFPGKQTE